MRRVGDSGWPQGASAPSLFSLDDGCLANIFSRLTPLPDLFNVATVCKRFHHVAGDRRLALVVAEDAAEQSCAPSLKRWGEAGANVVSSLQQAVERSLPGHTIFVEPGRHHVAQVNIRHPLRLVGEGASDTVLVVPRGAAGLVVHSNCRLQGLGVQTVHTGSCVEHHAGRLVIHACRLRCADQPSFEHLSAPITSLARAASSSLSVVDTSLDGGASAVRCLGTGVISAARVICLSRSASLWFDVIATDADALANPLPAVLEKNFFLKPSSDPALNMDASPCAVLTSREP